MTEQWLFVSDVDDTLLGDDIALAELMTALQSALERVITAYNSSRPCASLRTGQNYIFQRQKFGPYPCASEERQRY